jgi:hypothetical protein
VRVAVVPVGPEVAGSQPEASVTAREAVCNALQARQETGLGRDRPDELAPAGVSAEAIDFDPTP